jgi:hypothetical protein
MIPQYGQHEGRAYSVPHGLVNRLTIPFRQWISAKLSTDLSLGHNIEHHPTRSTGGRENKKGDALTTPTFQKHDRVAFRDSPEVQGEIVELWKGDFYKVAWDSGITYQGKTTIVSANVIRKKES